MLSALWHALIYKPFYNGLITLIAFVPLHDVGLAIILLTVLVKVALYPLAKKAVIAQTEMKSLEGDLNAIKAKYKDDKKKVAEETMKLYREKGVNPVSGCLPAIVQIPFIIGLYYVFWKGITIDPALLYSLVPAPDHLNTVFLGLVDLTQKSLPLAFLAAASQYVYAHLSAKAMPQSLSASPTPQEEFARAMQVQMKYVFPAMIGFIAYQFSAAVALYWVVGNIVSIVQDMWVRRSLSPRTS